MVWSRSLIGSALDYMIAVSYKKKLHQKRSFRILHGHNFSTAARVMSAGARHPPYRAAVSKIPFGRSVLDDPPGRLQVSL